MADVSGAPSNLALAVKEQGAAGAPRPVASEAGQQNSIQVESKGEAKEDKRTMLTKPTVHSVLDWFGFVLLSKAARQQGLCVEKKGRVVG
eukprot:scaffold94023_cov18-Tisochrysis_lutea.AAC.1